MKCPSCGTNNPDQAKLCMECGFRFSLSNRPEVELSLSGGATLDPAARQVELATEFEGTHSGQPTVALGSMSESGRAPAFAPGLVVGAHGRYELIELAGQGGMGTVYKARDRKLDRTVALKRLRAEDAAGRLVLDRFDREARSIAQLTHTNIVAVYDYDRDDDGPYIVMEFVNGLPLDVQLRDGAFPEDEAVRIFEGVCRGVGYAHKRGIIHRDIKPSNVMLDEDGVPKLLDFGLARGAAGLELSMSGYGMGTLDYAAPEQKRDAKNVDERADIYSLGATFYELLTGLKPVPLHVAKAPARWQDIIAKSCEPVPADRFKNLENLLASIDGVRASHVLTSAGDELDDLSCPDCKTMNTLEARFCRKCGAGLFVPCPACEADLRLGLRHCDKCGASVDLAKRVLELRTQAETAVEERRLGVAERTMIEALEILAGNSRKGAAQLWESKLQDRLRRVRVETAKAEALAGQAAESEESEDYDGALAKLTQAVTINTKYAADLQRAQADFPALMPLQQARRLVEQAEKLEEEGWYEDALKRLESAVKLNKRWEKRLSDAQEKYPALIKRRIADSRTREAKILIAAFEDRQTPVWKWLFPGRSLGDAIQKLEKANSLHTGHGVSALARANELRRGVQFVRMLAAVVLVSVAIAIAAFFAQINSDIAQDETAFSHALKEINSAESPYLARRARRQYRGDRHSEDADLALEKRLKMLEAQAGHGD